MAYIKRNVQVYINWNEQQIMTQEEYERILKDMESTGEPSFNEMDYFGNGGEELNGNSEQTAELASDSDRGSGNANSQISQG